MSALMDQRVGKFLSQVLFEIQSPCPIEDNPDRWLTVKINDSTSIVEDNTHHVEKLPLVDLAKTESVTEATSSTGLFLVL